MSQEIDGRRIESLVCSTLVIDANGFILNPQDLAKIDLGHARRGWLESRYRSWQSDTRHVAAIRARLIKYRDDMTRGFPELGPYERQHDQWDYLVGWACNVYGIHMRKGGVGPPEELIELAREHAHRWYGEARKFEDMIVMLYLRRFIMRGVVVDLARYLGWEWNRSNMSTHK